MDKLLIDPKFLRKCRDWATQAIKASPDMSNESVTIAWAHAVRLTLEDFGFEIVPKDTTKKEEK